jgi:hypothetical protein
MKYIIFIVSLAISNSLWAVVSSGIPTMKIVELNCNAKSFTGTTEFELKRGEIEAKSITDSNLYGRGIVDEYRYIHLNTVSKNNDGNKYGEAFVAFSFAYNSESPSSKKFGGLTFFIKSAPKFGTNIYEATLVGTTTMGYPYPGKTIYHYIADGSCEITIEKKEIR